MMQITGKDEVPPKFTEQQQQLHIIEGVEHYLSVFGVCITNAV
jgi:hypothetical protein